MAQGFVLVNKYHEPVWKYFQARSRCPDVHLLHSQVSHNAFPYWTTGEKEAAGSWKGYKRNLVCQKDEIWVVLGTEREVVLEHSSTVA